MGLNRVKHVWNETEPKTPVEHTGRTIYLPYDSHTFHLFLQGPSLLWYDQWMLKIEIF